MRILHTSDWHIGHKIYERSRIDEHTQFLHWLLNTIIEKKVDVLLISGDIFDSSLPSADATDLYYRFLHNLHTQTNAHAVIIAGNHDSAKRLAAPKEFLKMADIHVTGNFQKLPKECVISISKNGETASFAAVPYLNEIDILSHVSLEGEVERNQRYREAIKKIYTECMSAMPQDSIRILMGHFFMNGGKIGDSERITTVGDTQPIRTGDLPEGADYIALGHLHRSQKVAGNGCPIIYSGSPIPINFKEAEYEKNVFMVDTDGKGTCNVCEVTVPTFKKLVRIKGTFDEIIIATNFGNWKDKYIEVKVKMDKPQVEVKDKIIHAFDSKGGKVLNVDSIFPDMEYDESMSANDIKSRSPSETFKDFYNKKYGDTSPAELDELLTTFNELIELSNAQDGES